MNDSLFGGILISSPPKESDFSRHFPREEIVVGYHFVTFPRDEATSTVLLQRSPIDFFQLFSTTVCIEPIETATTRFRLAHFGIKRYSAAQASIGKPLVHAYGSDDELGCTYFTSPFLPKEGGKSLEKRGFTPLKISLQRLTPLYLQRTLPV